MVHLLHEPDDRPRIRRLRFRPSRVPLDPRRQHRRSPRELAHLAGTRDHPAVYAIFPTREAARAGADEEE